MLGKNKLRKFWNEKARTQLFSGFVVALLALTAVTGFFVAIPKQTDAASITISDITTIDVTSTYDATNRIELGSSGIYDNGLSLQHPGHHYSLDPNWFLWVNETNGTGGQTNLGGTATDSHSGGSVTMLHDGTLIFTRGGYFDTIPADLWTSNTPYDIHNWTQKLSDYITVSGGCSLSSAVTQNNTFLVAYRNGANDAASTGQQILGYNTSTWTKYKDVEIALGETWEGHALCPCYNWMRFDPRYNYTFVTWVWKEEAGSSDNWGSPPFIYTDDNGQTWKRANGTAYALPIRYSDISGWESKADIPDDSIANNLYSCNYGMESGVTPDGHPYMAVPHQDTRGGPGYGYFWLWNGTAWESHNLSSLVSYPPDTNHPYFYSFSCGTTKDYLVYVFADANDNATLKARISSDNGQTWSNPIEVCNVTSEGNVAITGISYCQPTSYDDNYVRFFYSFYNWSSGTPTSDRDQCKVKWVKFAVGEPNQPPTVSITSPSEGATVNGTITITGTASDSDGTVQSVEVKIDSGSWQTATGTTSWSYSWDSTGVSDGTHTIYARSYDGTDYSTEDSVTVTVNNTAPNQPPTVSITSPSEGATVNGTITITGTASDSDGTVQSVEVKIDSGSWQTATGTTSWSYSWDSTGVSDGTHTIYARSYDGTDYSTEDSVTVTVNNTAPNQPPTAAFTYSINNLTVTFTDGSTDSDGTIVSWNWSFGDGQYSTTQNPQHTYSSYGTYSVNLTVTDNDGATNTVSESITLATGGGDTVSSDINTWYLIIGIMAFAIVAMMMVVFAGKRR